MGDSLHDRGKALEDAFFKQKDEQLLKQFKKNMDGESARDALSAATGINDKELLQKLVDEGVSAESIASFSLIPLVVVAWADNKMEAEERVAILKAAESAGISSGDPSFEIISNWLENKPDSKLLANWKEYVSGLKASLDPADFTNLKEDIIGRARHVAESAGGFLGLTSKVSSMEEAKLKELERAFE